MQYSSLAALNIIITGKVKFAILEIKKEARDSIQSVIDQYRYCPEFSYFRTQVVALTSTINIVRVAFNKVNKRK